MTETSFAMTSTTPPRGRRIRTSAPLHFTNFLRTTNTDSGARLMRPGRTGRAESTREVGAQATDFRAPTAPKEVSHRAK